MSQVILDVHIELLYECSHINFVEELIKVSIPLSGQLEIWVTVEKALGVVQQSEQVRTALKLTNTNITALF